MTDDRLDPRFERALRATLAELDPGNPPAQLQRRGDRRAGRSARPGRVRFNPSMALGGLAAALLVAVVGIGVLPRFSATVAPQPSVAPVPGVRLELVSDDPLAPLADIVQILDARLGAAGLGDSTIVIDGGRIVVDAPVDPGDAAAVTALTRLLTAQGEVEGLATGLDEIVPGQDVARGRVRRAVPRRGRRRRRVGRRWLGRGRHPADTGPGSGGSVRRVHLLEPGRDVRHHGGWHGHGGPDDQRTDHGRGHPDHAGTPRRIGCGPPPGDGGDARRRPAAGSTSGRGG